MDYRHSIVQCHPIWLVATCLLWLSGCSSGEQADQLAVFPVTGEVRVAGSYAPGLTVVLHPAEGSPAAEKGLRPTGTVDDDGAYTLSTYTQGDGAPAGAYVVTLQWLQDAPPRPNGPPEGFEPPTDKFQGKYNDPQTSPWPVTVEEGENVLDTINIP